VGGGRDPKGSMAFLQNNFTPSLLLSLFLSSPPPLPQLDLHDSSPVQAALRSCSVVTARAVNGLLEPLSSVTHEAVEVASAVRGYAFSDFFGVSGHGAGKSRDQQMRR